MDHSRALSPWVGAVGVGAVGVGAAGVGAVAGDPAKLITRPLELGEYKIRASEQEFGNMASE
ncbi:hypothetical protein AZA_66349 [Nitrospirillum viridazoti Y2]|nr:hypothetical protein AZA_66349 [Nitrospirillum amazonense Y2]